MLEIPLALPPWTQLGQKIESMIRKAAYDYNLFENVEHLAVALSGGKDSLTLLYMLAAIRGKGFPFFKLSAFHVTGDYSCGASVQLNFLKPICEKLDVDLEILEQKAEQTPNSCYPCSRERRRLLFQATKEKNISTVAFGHHRDDSLQTLLMNLLHKGEFAANLPKIYMKHYDTTIIRPLIYVSEKKIIEFSKQNSFNRVLCRCPIGQNSMRKKTDYLLNYIEKTFPEARTNLALAAKKYGSTKASQP